MATVAASNTATAAGSTTLSERLVSLDVFRGLTMASMVMVNNQGPGSYYQLEHASWHGLTFTDLVFPFFVWIVGVAMTLSTAKRVERGENKTQLLLHVAKRAAVIFLIGLGLNGFPSYDLAHLRIPGVLQRIAICYLIAGIIFLYSGLRGRVLWLVGCSALYWVLMAPYGYDKLTNFSAQVDQMVLSTDHLYRHTKTWDPEGVVSTLPSIGTCLFGILTGMLLRRKLDLAEKTTWMFLGGNALVWLAVILDNLQPINKQIWTVPYMLVTAGLANIVFAACYWLADGQNYRGWYTKFFVIFGMNAIAVYIFHGLMGRLLDPMVQPVVYAALESPLGAANTSLIYSLIHVTLSFAFAWVLYRKQWFLKF
ncbi:MAG: DUF5009 domain-containing protein [Bryobacterales bacterium]|nr:DUF5009 domain-containing protein [Bryobacterales bacterium]